MTTTAHTIARVLAAVLFIAIGSTRAAGQTVVFVCEHGVTKSVMATAYFNHLARERGLPYRAVFRGTNSPGRIVALRVNGLHDDGVEIPEGKPTAISTTDVKGGFLAPSEDFQRGSIGF